MDPASTTRGKWMALTAAFLGWMFDGLEIGLFPLVSRPALYELLGEQAQKNIVPWTVAITSLFLVGAACGGLLFGWMGDRVGRVRAMIWSVLTYSIFSGLCAFAAEAWQLGALRFLSALGMGGEWSLGVALVMEIWPSKARPMLAGLIGAAANFGFMLIGWLALARSDPTFNTWLQEHFGGIFPDAWFTSQGYWRFLVFLGAVPALLTFFIRIFVPESEKWKHAAAAAPKVRVPDIFVPGLSRMTILGACLAAVALLGTWGSVQQATPWANQMASQQAKDHPELGINPAAETAWTQIYIAGGAIVGTMTAALLAQQFNRRSVYFALCLLSLGICQYLFRGIREFGTEFIVMATLANGLTAAFYGWLPLYLPELFPTRVRAMGQGFSFNSGRILAAVAAIIVAVQYRGKEDYPSMCAVTSLVYVVGLGLIWLCPETKGRPLPE
jgi:MFS family permease